MVTRESFLDSVRRVVAERNKVPLDQVDGVDAEVNGTRRVWAGWNPRTKDGERVGKVWDSLTVVPSSESQDGK